VLPHRSERAAERLVAVFHLSPAPSRHQLRDEIGVPRIEPNDKPLSFVGVFRPHPFRVRHLSQAKTPEFIPDGRVPLQILNRSFLMLRTAGLEPPR